MNSDMSITLKNYAQKKASSIEGRQFIKEESVTINGMSSLQQLYDIVQKDKENLRMGMFFIETNPYLDRQPKRLKSHEANGRQNLKKIFQLAGMKEDLWSKFAIMNGMALDYVPQKNQLIKIIK